MSNSDKNAWLKCCRYCRHFDPKDSHCYNKNIGISAGEDLSVYQVAEKGWLDEVLEESLGSIDIHEPFVDLETAFKSYGLSNKRVEILKKLVDTGWTELKQILRERVGDDVAYLYQTRVTECDSYGKLFIENPEDFCCKEWC